MKLLYKSVLTFSAMSGAMLSISAQNFYHRIDLASNNIYTFVASNLISAGLNSTTDDKLIDTSYQYTYVNTSGTDMKTSVHGYDIAGLTARDIFADVTAGAKLGYQSFNPGSFNWGIFGSAHYRVNQFKMEMNDLEGRHNIHRLGLGGGLMFTFGSIERDSRVIVEAGVRYNIPIHYNGQWGDKASDILNSGISSHFAIRIGGFNVLQGIGVFADISHYNLVKNSASIPQRMKVRPYTFGITYTIMPWNVH